jgi:hypothetical protein
MRKQIYQCCVNIIKIQYDLVYFNSYDVTVQQQFFCPFNILKKHLQQLPTIFSL